MGDAGNAPDATTGLGAVNYAYSIGEFDVTAAQYVAFLNAVAGTDPYGLYSTSMAGNADCGIQRSGSPGSYSYSVDTRTPTARSISSSLVMRCRFCNWLTNGQPTGAENLTTTENGSYYLNGATSNAATSDAYAEGQRRLRTSHGKRMVQGGILKGGGTNAGYWAYPTRA